MTKLSGSGLIANAVSGLTNSYGILASQNKDGKGLTVSNLTNLSQSTLSQLNGNTSFVSYLTSNFGSMDKNADGIISAEELSKATTTMQTQGLTRDQISNLCTNMANSDTYQTVLEYFDKIDSNHDGRVTDAEIRAFQYTSQRQKLDTQFNSVRSSNMSLYYANENESAPTSIVDGFYPDV